MSDYNCPLCNKNVPRDLMVFLQHTDSHIIAAIQKQNPSWVEKDGSCQKCAEFYRLQKTGALPQQNLSARGRMARFWLGLALLASTLLLFSFARTSQHALLMKFALPLVLFFAYLSLFQAKGKTCVFLSLINKKESGGKLEPVTEENVRLALKKRSVLILRNALIGTFIHSLFYLFLL